MSSANPPYPWFSGIQYNPSFFASSSSGDLTKAQANALYLRKTVPDSASALETFNGGIKTNSLNALNTSSPLNIGNTSLNLYLRSNNDIFIEAELLAGVVEINGKGIAVGDIDDTYSVNMFSTEFIALESKKISTYSDEQLDFQSGIININSSNPFANTVAIGNAAFTSEIVNTTTALKLNSDNATANTVAIGNATGTSSVSVNGTNPMNVNCGIKSNSLDVITSADALDIGLAQTNGLLKIGTNASRLATSTIQLGITSTPVTCSNILCSGETINNAINKTTGGLSIGGGQTTGYLYIGGGEGIQGRTGEIQIGTAPNTNCTIAIGSSVGVGGSIVVRRPINFAYVNTPFAPTSLGYRSQLVTNGTVTTSATISTITQWSSFTVPVGVWMYEAVLFMPASINNIEWYISSTTATADSTRLCGGVSVAGSGVGSRASGIIQQAATSAIWYLNGKSTVASVSITNINICLTRIA